MLSLHQWLVSQKGKIETGDGYIVVFHSILEQNDVSHIYHTQFVE